MLSTEFWHKVFHAAGKGKSLIHGLPAGLAALLFLISKTLKEAGLRCLGTGMEQWRASSLRLNLFLPVAGCGSLNEPLAFLSLTPEEDDIWDSVG